MPVTWVWAMCHGMWPVGIVIGVVAVLGLALDRGHPAPHAGQDGRGAGAVGGASRCSPRWVPGLFPAVLRVGSRAKYFYEWDPPDYTKPWVAMLAVILALAFGPRMRRGGLPWFDLALLGLAALWAVYSLRTVPVAACMAAPLAFWRCSRCSVRGPSCAGPSGCSWSAATCWPSWGWRSSYPARRTSRGRPRSGSTTRSAGCRAAPQSSTTRPGAAT